jgi:hypothetical protein
VAACGRPRPVTRLTDGRTPDWTRRQCSGERRGPCPWRQGMSGLGDAPSRAVCRRRTADCGITPNPHASVAGRVLVRELVRMSLYGGGMATCCRDPATLCGHAQDATREFMVHAPAPLPRAYRSPPTHNRVGLARITVRSSGGRSCRDLRTSKPCRPTSRRRPRRRTQVRVPAIIRNPEKQAGYPRQHRFPGPRALRRAPLNSKPQLRGCMKAPAPRLELGTCRLTGGLPSAREQRPCEAGQPRHLHKGW